jgi:hypothetical protein
MRYCWNYSINSVNGGTASNQDYPYQFANGVCNPNATGVSKVANWA